MDKPLSITRHQIEYASATMPEPNKLALASLIVGIVGLLAVRFLPFIGGSVALVTGIIAFRRTCDPRVRGRVLAKAGIAFGLLGLLSSAIVVFALPTLTRTKCDLSPRTLCAYNLRKVGAAMQMYADDHYQQFPPDLGTLTQDEGLPASDFVCPNTNIDIRTVQGVNLVQWVNQNTDYIYLDAGKTSPRPSGEVVAYEKPSNNGDGMNILFGDGHVAWFEMADAKVVIKKQTGRGP